MAKTKDALKLIEGMIGRDQKLRELIEAESINVRVAGMIYNARIKAGLTQKELAKVVGTTQSVIARLEDADYQGHSLNMLHRIAAALHKRVEIRFLESSRRPSRAVARRK